jgi:hypothetical protein
MFLLNELTVLEKMLTIANLLKHVCNYNSRNSSVGTATGYGLEDRGSRFRFPAGAGNFSLHHCVQNGSGAHPASYSMGTWGSSPAGKAAFLPIVFPKVKVKLSLCLN